jgi:hypothetical protein
MKYLKLIIIFFTINLFKGQNDIADFLTTWYEIEKQQEGYRIVDCGYEGEWIRIKKDSINEHGVMEESFFKIHHIKEDGNSTSIYINGIEKYIISWIDKKKGIIQVSSSFNENKRYYVAKSYLGRIERVKGTGKDCVSNDKFEETKQYAYSKSEKKYSADGTWKNDCKNGVASMTIKDKEGSLVVLFNQIYVEMMEIKRYDFEKGIAYKLKSIPEDNGSFGITLPWKDYLNNKPIVYLKILKNNEIDFYWYGFYNNKTKKRDITECQFDQENEKQKIILKKCNP